MQRERKAATTPYLYRRLVRCRELQDRAQQFKPIRVSGFEIQSGGPKQVTREIVEKMYSVLNEKQTRVKIMSHLLEEGS